jgi:aspartyl-tRNA(Asn)/glutamyl-tRNA(Gln) amidotransferase subunit B
LPVLNRKCVEAGIKTALALSCKINEISMFDRKHYFYADLPAGYQITQQRAPLASNGSLSFPVFVPGVTKKPYYKTVRLHQLQLEQDSGKSLHDEESGISLIDLNRAGVPLMELVFDPDLNDGEEAAALVKELVLILGTLETCNCKMEEGSLRVDANISIHKENEPLGIRTEVKNIGSIRGVAQAVAYEIERQIGVKNEGGAIVNETRMWDAQAKVTVPMRDKEVVQDYRFMPEPNLPPLYLNLKQDTEGDLINVPAIEKCLPPMPQHLRESLMNEKHLTQEMSIILVNETILMKYFNEITAAYASRSPKTVSNLLVNEFMSICNKNKINIEDCKISTEQIGELVDMLESQYVNLILARLILTEMLKTSKSPKEISDERNWKQITDDKEIREMCDEVLASESGLKMVKAYKSGKTKVLLAIAGEINRKSENRINMAKVMEILKELVSKQK